MLQRRLKRLLGKKLLDMKKDEKEAEKYAVLLLRYRLRGKKEMERRLQQRGFSDKVIRNVIKKLEQQGFLNDEKFIEMWIEEVLSFRKKGKRAVFFNLIKNGVEEEKIEKVWKEWREREKEVAREVAESLKKKCFSLYEIKKKLYERGFSNEAIEEAVEWILNS